MKEISSTSGDSGVMIFFYPGEPRITSVNGKGWKVPGIRNGPSSMLVFMGWGPEELGNHLFQAGCSHSLCPSIYGIYWKMDWVSSWAYWV